MMGKNHQILRNNQNGNNINAGAVTASVFEHVRVPGVCRACAQSPVHIRSSHFGAGTGLPLGCNLMGQFCLFRCGEEGLRGQQPWLQVQRV